jgi:small-conductance mechanosensitive channel
MRKISLVVVPIAVLAAIGFAAFSSLKPARHSNQSPYINQQSSPVRGLSAKEVDDLLNGRGAGYARTAELNSYPGPLHVLELKEPLRLSAEQVQKVETAFQKMRAESQRIGKTIVQREQLFSQSFANGAITPTELKTQTKALADLYAELRATHLKAHLEITPVLSSEQIMAYNDLRGYDSATEHQGHH